MKMAIGLGLAGILLSTTQATAVAPATRPNPVGNDDLASLGSAVQSSLPADSKVLAVCGPSEGHAYYLWPQNDGWVDDPISRGRLVFVVDKDNRPDIVFQDASGQFIKASADGGVLVFTFADPETSSFGVVETYGSTGVTQTYSVSYGPDKKRYALWTSIKSHVSAANVSKVSAYLSHCI